MLGAAGPSDSSHGIPLKERTIHKKYISKMKILMVSNLLGCHFNGRPGDVYKYGTMVVWPGLQMRERVDEFSSLL